MSRFREHGPRLRSGIRSCTRIGYGIYSGENDMDEPQDRTYEYKPCWSAILFGVLLCGAAATVAAYSACSNFGLRIWGIKLPPGIAACTWWAMAVTSLGGGFLFLLMAVHRLIRVQRILLTPAAIFVPKGRFSSKVVIIPFSTVTDLSLSQVHGQRFLKISHQQGTFTIASSLLPEREDLEVVHKMLLERVEQSKQGIRALQYQRPPDITAEEAQAAIARDDPAELCMVPISVSMYHEDLEWSEAICIRLSTHRDATVRGNAVLGFGHLSRRFRKLDEGVVRPIIEKALIDADPYVRGQAHAAADDVAHFLGWKVKGQNE
jgi:hypothetical protein